MSSRNSPPSTVVEMSRTPVALFSTYLWSQSECSRLSWTATRDSSVRKVSLSQLITESRYCGKDSTMSMIWLARIEPSITTKPTHAASTPKKTRNVASPRRIPRAAIRLTAGSTASARKKAISTLISSPMS